MNSSLLINDLINVLEGANKQNAMTKDEILNSKLSKSAKKSNHLKGIAIDIYIFDINGDGRFNDVDIAILENSNNKVEREHP